MQTCASLWCPLPLPWEPAELCCGNFGAAQALLGLWQGARRAASSCCAVAAVSRHSFR